MHKRLGGGSPAPPAQPAAPAPRTAGGTRERRVRTLLPFATDQSERAAAAAGGGAWLARGRGRAGRAGRSSIMAAGRRRRRVGCAEVTRAGPGSVRGLPRCVTVGPRCAHTCRHLRPRCVRSPGYLSRRVGPNGAGSPQQTPLPPAPQAGGVSVIFLRSEAPLGAGDVPVCPPPARRHRVKRGGASFILCHNYRC